MDRTKTLLLLCILALVALTAVAQETPAKQPADSESANGLATNATTVRGCLERSRGNYLLIEDKTSLVYVLKGVDSKLDNQVGREVEVTGQLHSGTIKTGVRSEKQGSNPSDTIHGIDGVPLQVGDVHKDVRRISVHCKAADQP
jgi:hypothetical protein